MKALGSQAIAAWSKFWFGVEDLSALKLVRVGLGVVLLVHYLGLGLHLDDLYGPNGLVSAAIGLDANRLAIPTPLVHFSQTWVLYLVYGVLMLSLVLFTRGWKVNWVKWVVWYAHYSFIQRNPYAGGGADDITLQLLFLLCLARLEVQPTPGIKAWTSACLRLAQIQLAVVYFFAGAHKLQMENWWSGDALWAVFVDPEFTSGWAQFLAHHYWLVNIFCYGTLIFEVGYPFLVVNRRLRHWVLFGAFALHAGIAAMMGLYFFASMMIAANLLFVDRRVRDRVERIVRMVRAPKAIAQ